MHVHLIGIGGSGLSAIARVLLESGYSVSGSDRQFSPLAKSLQEAGARIYIGHQPDNIQGAGVVLRSSAIPDDNLEVQAALKTGIPVYKRAEFLGQMMAGKRGIAIAGSHGKTTTTAMIAWVLTALGQDPSYIIGGISKNLGTNAHAGKGSAFVIEADEYDRMFLGLLPEITVVTNIEHDHPDCFPTPEDYYQAFIDFTSRLVPGGVLLACRSYPGSARLFEEAKLRGIHAVSYGVTEPGAALRGERCNYEATQLEVNVSGGFSFNVHLNSPSAAGRLGTGSQPSNIPRKTVRVELQVPGVHNVSNAMAALAVIDLLGLSLKDAALALAEYRGTSRRFDVIGESGGVTVIDDYAHHPTKIRATLLAARLRYPQRSLWVVWQPHTYSRTRALFDDFAASFSNADHVVVTEVFAAREPVTSDFSSRQLVTAMSHPDATFVAELDDTTTFLLEHLHPGDVLLVLSAGDADQVSMKVLAALEERSHIHA